MLLYLSSTLYSAEQGKLICVLQISSDRDTVGYSGGLYAVILQKSCDIKRGSLAFNGGIGGDNDLVSSLRLDTGKQLRNCYIVRGDACSGGDDTAENVVYSGIVLQFFKGDDRLCILDYADETVVTLLV